MAKQRILVIDDEEDMLENCSRILDRLGYEALLESDGGKGVVRFEQEHPVVTLTDLRMPGMDGLEVLRTIRRIDPEALVILFTAFATVETAVEAVKEGAFDYIPKPFSADQLQVVIERALTQRRLLDENRRLREQLTETYRFPPTRRTCRSCRTRRSLACSGRGMSPTSSRKLVPPLASSKRPRRVAIAPVKAPFSWPKSSLSRRCSGREAQSMGMKARAARELLA